MTNWNIPKIREECLVLMGHTIVFLGDSRKFSPHGDLLPSTYFSVVSPFGETRIVRYLDWAMSNAPDPTCSLEDAIPLMHLQGVSIYPTTVREGVPAFCAEAMSPKDLMLNGIEPSLVHESAAMAVCLMALRCAGRNLDNFKSTT